MKFLSLFFVCVVFSFASCATMFQKQNSSAGVVKEGELSIVKAYVQKEIPGQEHEKALYLLKIELNETLFKLKNIDSIKFETNTYKEFVSSSNGNDLQMMTVQLRKIPQEGNVSKATVYYNQDKQVFEQMVSVTKQTTVFRP